MGFDLRFIVILGLGRLIAEHHEVEKHCKDRLVAGHVQHRAFSFCSFHCLSVQYLAHKTLTFHFNFNFCWFHYPMWWIILIGSDMDVMNGPICHRIRFIMCCQKVLRFWADFKKPTKDKNPLILQNIWVGLVCLSPPILSPRIASTNPQFQIKGKRSINVFFISFSSDKSFGIGQGYNYRYVFGFNLQL